MNDVVQGAANDDEGTKGSGGISLASIGLLVTPLLAILGGLALTGTVGRVQRDEPFWFSVAIGLVLFSGAAWVAADTLTAPQGSASRSWTDKIIRLVSLGAALGGFVLALTIAVASANNESRPQITPTLSADRTTLTTHVTASNLPTDNRLAFRIDLLRESKTIIHLYQSYVGPNSDGDVDQTITTRLPRGGFEEIGIKAYTGTTSPSCDDFSEVQEDSTFGSGTGCVIITLPRALVAKETPLPQDESG